MKRFVILYGIIFTLCFSASAQNSGDDIQVIKMGYITRQLNLTPEEAQRFWPIYNQYTEEIRKIRIDAIGNREPIVVTEEKIVNARKKYSNEFSRALPPNKVNLFFRSEIQFGNFVQREKERRQLRMQQRRPILR
jgi:Skp family chaperone for outer membrane proteins